MKILFIESIDNNNDNKDEKNVLLRVITGDTFSTNDEFKAMVTIDLIDYKESVLYRDGIELVMHGVFLGKLISIPLSDIDASEATETTHTCFIMAESLDFDKNLEEVVSKYEA